jgi:hypothetical protein
MALTEWCLDWRRDCVRCEVRTEVVCYLYEYIIKINQQIKIPLSLFQATSFHFTNVLILILLLSEGRAGEA